MGLDKKTVKIIALLSGGLILFAWVLNNAAEVLRLVFWMLTKYAGMSGLAFWTNIMFVLLTCARGWAGLTLYKTQEETL